MHGSVVFPTSACCHNMQPVSVSVGMTRVSPRLGEPIKRALSSDCPSEEESVCRTEPGACAIETGFGVEGVREVTSDPPEAQRGG